MSDIHQLDAAYCPACGEPVATAQALAVTGDEPIAETFMGTYADDSGHVVVNPGEVRLYKHANQGDRP